MTNDEYQKACDIAANYRDVNMSHEQAVGYVYGFKQGVNWANANPSPRVMRLVTALEAIKKHNEYMGNIQYSVSWTIADKALAAFEDKP